MTKPIRVFVQTNQVALDQVIVAMLHEARLGLRPVWNMDVSTAGDSLGIVDWSALKSVQKRKCLYFERYYKMGLIDISGTLPIHGRRARLPMPFRWADLIEVLKEDAIFVRG